MCIRDRFTDENQQFVIVIKNVTKSTISAKINNVEKDRNLRINQIILPDGSSDGPFSKEMKYAKKKNGTYKIVIGKNLMAEGKLVAVSYTHLDVYKRQTLLLEFT